MKRTLLLALVPLLLAMSSCTISPAGYYDHAQLYLGSGDFETAASMFSQLGEYGDSADYALYCAGLHALSTGDMALARANLAQVHPFKSSSRYLSMMDAMELESEGSLEEALALYDALGSFEDCRDRAIALRERIPQRDLAKARALMGAHRWEQALTILEALGNYDSSAELAEECRGRITREAYDQAADLCRQGQHAAARSAFEALGDVLDAPARALACRDAIYQQLEEDYRTASLSTAESLMQRYADMADYQASAARLNELQARYSINLELLDRLYEHPVVCLGGMNWRVILAEGSQVTLLCQQLFPSSGTDLLPAFSAEENAAILSFDFPRLTLDLDRYVFTQGKGTPEDPYQ